MYVGAVAQTVYILEHDLNTKGITVKQFPRGVKHARFLQSLQDAEDEEDEEDDESGDEELPDTGAHSSRDLSAHPQSGTSTDQALANLPVQESALPHAEEPEVFANDKNVGSREKDFDNLSPL